VKWLIASPAPLVLAGLLYLGMATAYWRAGQRGMCVAFLAYAAANGGFVWAWLERAP